MTRLSIMACATMALLTAAPAMAQDSMSNNAMSSSSAMSSDSQTCEQLMAKANGITSGSPAGMSMAQKEMSLANSAKQKNDEAGCQMHMKNAIRDLRS